MEKPPYEMTDRELLDEIRSLRDYHLSPYTNPSSSSEQRQLFQLRLEALQAEERQRQNLKQQASRVRQLKPPHTPFWFDRFDRALSLLLSVWLVGILCLFIVVGILSSLLGGGAGGLGVALVAGLFLWGSLLKRRDRHRRVHEYHQAQARLTAAQREHDDAAERWWHHYFERADALKQQERERQEQERTVRRQWGLYAYLTDTFNAFLADHPTLTGSTGVALRTLWFAPFTFKAGEHIPHGARDWLTAADRQEADRRLSSLAETDIARLLARERAQTRAVSLGAITRHIYTRRTLAAQHEYEQELRRYEQERAAGYKDARKPLAPEPYPVVATPVPPALVQPEAVRFQHTYIVGKTRYGKTNLIQHLLLQDFAAGRGVLVLSPEEELFRDHLLSFIPEQRLDDVLYFNPADGERPVPFNPFLLDEGEKVHIKTQETFTIFERAIPNLAAGARMVHLLKMTIATLIERQGSTLADIPRLLDPRDPTLRDEVTATTRDEETRTFWADEYPTYPHDAARPITTRLSDFWRPPLDAVLCHPTATLPLARALQEGKLLFFNLSPSRIGQLASQVLGQLLISKLQQVIFARDLLPDRTQKTPVYCYLDEFQTFVGTAAASYNDLLSKGGKQNFALYLAHQYTKQVPEVLDAILGNVSTLCALHLDYDDAQRIAKRVYVDDPALIQHQDRGEAVALVADASYQIRIPYVPDYAKPDYDLARHAVERSRARYGVPVPAHGSPPTPHPPTPPTSDARPRTRDADEHPDPDNEFLG